MLAVDIVDACRVGLMADIHILGHWRVSAFPEHNTDISLSGRLWGGNGSVMMYYIVLYLL